MGIGEAIEARIHKYRRWRQNRSRGPSGDYYRSGGNLKLYENLGLCSDDIVIDAGGYHGEWTFEIAARYGCRSMIFEPVPDFAERLKQRFASNNRIAVFPEGIAGKTEQTEMVLNANGSSTFNRGLSDRSIPVQMIDVAEIFARHNLLDVGCMKLNIEGAEYDVLDRMGEAGLDPRVRRLLIQFHQFVPRFEARRNKVREVLNKTHDLDWEFPFVWESWVRKGSRT